MTYNHRLYLDWFNNFLTIERFAEYYEISVKHARRVICKGRVIHQDKFGHHQVKLLCLSKVTTTVLMAIHVNIQMMLSICVGLMLAVNHILFKENIMEFKLRFDCDNAAFDDKCLYEVSRILHDLSRRITDNNPEHLKQYQNIYDYNGNNIGTFRLL